tara:strand:+ start:3106 stop:4155 length:1050 start_codon:yes stop_codon:yes gene_type:complete
VNKIFKNKKVLITGNTGFKGSWLSIILDSFGAKIYGISDNYQTTPNLNSLLNYKNIINLKCDINNFNKLSNSINEIKPDFIFHLAAQSQVFKSLQDPIETYKTNIIGTVNILESIRNTKTKCNCIFITSDKCYLNNNKKKAFKENDRLGGIDPYSASKAGAELVLFSYFNSFLKNKKNIRIGIARAGNVVGGGDWTKNRIIPDAIKAWSKNKILIIRNPSAIRPWQHVLEPINGYLMIADALHKDSSINGEAFNFGPLHSKMYTVANVIEELNKTWTDGKIKIKKDKNNVEDKVLKLNSNKSVGILGWKTKLNFKETIKLTGSWYYEYYSSKYNMNEITRNQIDEYFSK